MSLGVGNDKASIFSVGGGIIQFGSVGNDKFYSEKSKDEKRKPLESTVLYLPLYEDLEEKTGNSNITNYGVSLTNISGVKCGYFNGSSRIETNISTFTNVNHTLAAWSKRNGGDSAGIICSNPCGVFNGDVIYPNSAGDKYVYQSYTTSSNGFVIESNNLNQSEWHCVVFTGGKLYIDGILQGSGSGGYTGGQKYTIGGHTTNSSCTRKFLTGYIGDVVIDNSAWNEQQVIDYYKKTKTRYFV